MAKRSQKTKQYKFEIHCNISKPVLKLLQGTIKIYEVPDITRKYKEICDCKFEVTEGSIGFSMPEDADKTKGIPSKFIPVLRNIITSYYRGMILENVVHVWYSVPYERMKKFEKFQPDVV
jgi:hypothetical protein